MPRPVLAALLGLALLVATPAGAGSSAPVAACSAGRVSLTFDDGPSATVTPRLVRVLEEARVPATFFMVGERVASAPAAAKLVDRSGFLVANHSYRHANMRGQTRTQIRATLRATDRRLRAAGARPTRLMRPPYGAIDARVRDAIASTGLVPVLWDVDPRDWEGGSSATIAARILAQLRPHRSNIVLQHDGVGNSPASVSAVPRVVREARRRGYCFVALDEAGRPGFPTPRADLRVDDVREGRTARAVVVLDRPTARATWVRLVTRDRTARAGSDYERRDVVVRFPAGVQRRTVSVPVIRDGLDERTERFDVGLSDPFGMVVRDGLDVVAVADRNRPPVVRALDRSVVEPTAEPVTVDVRLRLDRSSGRLVRLRVRSVPGTATAEDFLPVDLRVRIPAGGRTVLVPVTVLPDAVEEPDETFEVRIVAVDNARPARRVATVTITPPPPPPPPPRSGRNAPRSGRDGAPRWDD